MSMLDRKLMRDLVRLWAQALAIALVVASGFATLILGIGARRSLDETRAAYYERYAFADVFASLKRAPKELGGRILEIPGAVAVELRVMERTLLDIEGAAAPVSGIVISLPDHGEARLNRLYMRAGRTPEPGKPDEAVVNEAFAAANHLGLGSHFTANINGRKRALEIVGIALSPEFIYALGPGDIVPDDRRFGVLWMSEKALAGLFDLEGAFNSVAVKLLSGESAQGVIERLDRLLERYGGVGAYARENHTSHAFLDSELEQLAAMSRVIPPIFLAVSAFLMNMTLARLIALEREQIGLLKALGYGRLAVASHYLKFALAIAVAGALVGAFAGTWLGRGLTRLYGDFFHFPFLIFRRDLDIYLFAAAVSGAAAVAGALRAVLQALSLPPAVAMQPPAPPRYSKLWGEGLGFMQVFSQLTIMALRSMVRGPVRAATTLIGIALAAGLLVTAMFALDSLEFMIDVSFFRSSRQHATLTLAEAQSMRVVQSVERLPGVMRAEPYRAVAVRLRNGHLERRLAIIGKPPGQDLSRVVDKDLRPVEPLRSGLLINDRVAEVLGLRRGDTVEVEVLEGKRGTRRAVVADIIESYLGLTAYMDLDALNELLDEGSRVSGIHISYDLAQEESLYRAVKRTPTIASVQMQRVSLAKFRETVSQNITFMTTVYVTLSVIIAFGVVYNSARVQLSERARELASLRVLGFTRAEVSRVLLTELLILMLLAQPLGWGLGYLFAFAVIQGFASDLFTIPFMIEPRTYARASLVVLTASAVSTLIVRRRVDRLDLVAVLKTRD
ncbi:MAG TPA: FtsX-like permease family protein [Hyphomicrobiaceae bacterium]|nr:FtsX-like permease family protein [Hyphomicrobiaceae bacterium]